MGYSMRTLEYRYTAWFPYIPRGGGAPGRPDLTKDIFDEELYYHKYNESNTLLFDERNERHNLIDSTIPRIEKAREYMRKKLVTYLRKEALFGLGELRDKYLSTIGQRRHEGEEKSNTSYRLSWQNVDSVKKLRKKRRREERLMKLHEGTEGTGGKGKNDAVVYQSVLLKSIGVNRNETRTREAPRVVPSSRPENKLRMMFDHGT